MGESMPLPLEGKVALVTGASRGIGLAIAIKLAEDGAGVVVCARTMEPDDSVPGSLQQTAERIRAAGRFALPLRLDVTDDAQCESVIEKAWSEMGRIDILVNNAGMLGGGGAFLESDPALLDEFYRTNLRAPYVLSLLAGRKMAAAGGGSIFNISSGLARLPSMDGGMGGRGHNTVYGMTKAGLDRFTSGVAGEMREKNVAVIAIYPGFTLTEVMAQRLPAGMDTSFMERPETTAKAIAYLARDAIPYAGQIVPARELVDKLGL